MKRLAWVALPIAITTAVAGCGPRGQKRAYEYMPDMARDPAYKAFAPNPTTHDGLTLQQPVAGTIPRGYHPFHYGPGDEEAARAGRELQNPFQPTPEILDEGKSLFQTYCMVCHGLDGQATGVPFAQNMYPPVPSLNSREVQDYTDGQLKWVIENGIGPSGMPASKGILNDDEMWSLVNYIRQLPAKGSLGEPKVYNP